MKKLLLILMLIGSFLWMTLKTTVLSAQELTVPDYSYGEVFSQYGTVTSQGVANPGPYGGYSTGSKERSSGVFLAHGYRWWGYPGNLLLICNPEYIPKFNFPGFHGIWDMSNLTCGNPPIGYMASWGGVIAEPDEQEIWSLIGTKHENGPTSQYCVDFMGSQICYNLPSSWGFGSSYGYLRKVVVVASTGLLQKGDPVDIKASLTSHGVIQGDGTGSGMGVLMLNKFSETPWHQWSMGREYLRWGDVEDIMGTSQFVSNMLGNLIISLNQTSDTSATVAIGDTIIVEIAYNNEIGLDNPMGVDEAEGWNGEKPSNLFSNINYVRNDSVRNLLINHGNHLSYDLISLTTGAILEPLTPDGPNLDTDGDGITDTQEKGPDGNNSSFDGNSDGIPDYQQDTVVSMHSFDGKAYVSLVIPGSTEFSSINVVENPSPTDAPDSTDFPFGFFEFSIDGLGPGDSVTVSLILHNGVSVDGYYKYGLTPDSLIPHWYKFMYDGQTGAEINQNIITLHFVDGLRGDEDITMNGSVIEPGGPAALPVLKPEIHVTPHTLDFLIRAVDDTTEARQVIIKNRGDTILHINDISVVWRDSIHFTITNNTCSDLNPDDTCSVNVVFNPQSLGEKEALLWIESNDPFNPTEAVILEGEGLASMIWDYGSLTFGNVSVGDSAISVYTLKNIGNTNLVIQSVVIQGDDATDFYYSNLPATPFIIGKNDSVQFNFVFKPGSVGDKTSTLRIFTNDLDLTRTLTGTGIASSYTIEGEVVTDNNAPVNAGTIFVYEPDQNNGNISMWWKPLESSNSFIFIDIPQGTVTLRFNPDTSQYPGYLMTYLGNKPLYSEADFFNLDKDTSGLEITLIQAPPPPNGNSDISGTFMEEDGSKSGSTLTYGEYNGKGTPVGETSVYLIDQSGNIFDFDLTSSSGEFYFENLPIGSYCFVADYVGFTMDEANDSLIIDKENQEYTISAVAQNKIITIEIENVTGLTSLTENSLIYVYPNPATKHIMLQFNNNMPADEYILKINSITGETLRNKKMHVYDSCQEFSIGIDDLPGGIYIISLSGNKTIYKARFIKLE